MMNRTYTIDRNEESLDFFRLEMMNDLKSFYKENFDVQMSDHKSATQSLETYKKDSAYRNDILEVLEEEVISHFELSVYEVVINVIDHSVLPDGKDPMIKAEIIADNSKIKASLVYNAEEFDFTTKKLPTVKKHFAEGKSRGLGVYIIRTLMDDYSYSFNDFVNTINLTKKIKL